MQLDGRVAIVLGASAEGGTGWAVAEKLANANVKVVVGARSLAPLQTLASRIGGLAVACDAGRPDDIANLVRTAREKFGPVDIAVNAAVLPTNGSISDSDPAVVQQSLDVNYIGNFHFVRETTKAMNDGGAIVLITSINGVQPQPPNFAYGCAKAATDCLVRYAALEYGPRGIRVNSILPGPIKTPLAAKLYAIPGAEEVRARATPLGRVALAEDIAQAVVALVQCDFVTGVNMPVSGGMHLTRPPGANDTPKP